METRFLFIFHLVKLSLFANLSLYSRKLRRSSAWYQVSHLDGYRPRRATLSSQLCNIMHRIHNQEALRRGILINHVLHKFIVAKHSPALPSLERMNFVDLTLTLSGKPHFERLALKITS